MPYPRLKNSKKLPSVKYSLLEYSKIESFTEKNVSKKLHTQKNGPSGALKRGHFRNCQHFCRSWGSFVAKHQKIEGGKIFYSRKKISQCRKNWKGDPLGFSNILSVAKQQKNWMGDPLRKKISRKKSLAVPKKIGRGDPLVSPGMVCYAGKQEKPFWFSSLDQIVQFGIIFCRTFGELFWSVRVDWKKRKATIIVAFHFMKRRLKINWGSRKKLTSKDVLLVAFKHSGSIIKCQKPGVCTLCCTLCKKKLVKTQNCVFKIVEKSHALPKNPKGDHLGFF